MKKVFKGFEDDGVNCREIWVNKWDSVEYIKIGLVVGGIAAVSFMVHVGGTIISDMYEKYNAHQTQHENYQNLENQVKHLRTRAENLGDKLGN